MASISALEAVESSSAMMESTNWLDMPYDLMVNILQRLTTVQKIWSAANVCRTWRRIVKDPAMWKVIGIDVWEYDYCTYYNLDYYTNCNLEMLFKKAVDLSCGELTDVSICSCCTVDLLDYIVQRSGKLKYLKLCCCEAITGRELSRAVKRLPQLEKLNLNNMSINNGDTEAIGRNCPQLKSFTGDFRCTPRFVDSDHAVAIGKSMPNLRHLTLFGSEITNVGLQAILNGCPHLEYLEIDMSCSFNLDRNLVNKCMERFEVIKNKEFL